MKRIKKDLSYLKKDIRELLDGQFPEGSDDEIFRDMLYNVAQLREDHFDVLETRLLHTAFRELRYAMKVFKPYRAIPKAAVFGSARTPKDHPNYKIANDFGEKLVKKGWMVITGGASGIMEAAMVGAGTQNSFGLNIMLPFEQFPNPMILGDLKLVNFKYFFTRKLMFLKESEATVLFPGGFGTFDEGFESFTLVQTGKAKPRPLILVDAKGSAYWSSLLKLIKKNLLEEKLISPSDLSLMEHFQDPQKAVDGLVHFYRYYDSSRFLKEKYLIRLKRPLSDDELKEINIQFKDLCVGGGFERLKDLSEDNHPDQSLERIVFPFNKTGYSRLRQLIDYFNALPPLS